MSTEEPESERRGDATSEWRHEPLVSVRSVRSRPWLMALPGAANLLLLRLAGFPTRRLVLLLAMSALLLALAIFDGAPARARRSVRAGRRRWLTATDLFAPTVVVATGGLRSPFMPVLLVNLIAMVALWRHRGATRRWLTGLAALIALLALAPSALTGPSVPRPYLEILTALNTVAALFLGVQIVSGVRDGLVSAQRSLSMVRERVVDTAVQRMRSLLQIGSKVAHELKNPLAAVKSLLQLEAEAIAPGHDGARPRLDGERSWRRLEVMLSDVARMEGVLREYLSFSRPLEDLRVGPIELAEVADVVAVLLEGRAAAAGVRLVRTGQVVRARCDARRIEDALLNVAANAIEATPVGGAVTIRTERRAGGAAIVVEDTGTGMSAALLEKVGTPFFTTRRQGTGLGVALARAALVQHGGRLEYASRPGEGTTATLAWPDPPRGTGPSGAG